MSWVTLHLLVVVGLGGVEVKGRKARRRGGKVSIRRRWRRIRRRRRWRRNPSRSETGKRE
jgi:hypothetical protein